MSSYTRMLIIAAVATPMLVACDAKREEVSSAALAKDPERLRAVMRECREQGLQADPKRCAAASDAYRQRFMGSSTLEQSRDGAQQAPVKP